MKLHDINKTVKLQENTDQLTQILDDIMVNDMGFESPHERKRDALDFREIHVTIARDALYKAFIAGTKAGRGGM